MRFAERGIVALAFDYFGRTAGVEKRENDWDYMPLVQQLTMEQVQADVSASVAHLSSMGSRPDLHRRLLLRRKRLAGGCRLRTRARRARSASTAGRAGCSTSSRSSTRRSSRSQGGLDQGIPHEDNVEFEEALSAAGKDYELARVRRRAAQLLRPQAGGVPGGLRPKPGSARSTSSPRALCAKARPGRRRVFLTTSSSPLHVGGA